LTGYEDIVTVIVTDLNDVVWALIIEAIALISIIIVLVQCANKVRHIFNTNIGWVFIYIWVTIREY
jgi:hypothetical protein